MPDCGDLNCGNAKIVWQNGKRYVKCEGENEYLPFDRFVTTALQAIIHDIDYIVEHIKLIEQYGLPLPFSHRSPESLDDVSGLVP